MRLPTFAQLQTFCERDHWTPKKRTDHIRYTKTIDGRLRRTRISSGSGQIQDPKLFAHILRDQLVVDHDEFWRVVEGSGPAQRPTPVQPTPTGELPAWVVAGLLKEGVLPDDVRVLSEEEARRLLIQLRSRPKP